MFTEKIVGKSVIKEPPPILGLPFYCFPSIQQPKLNKEEEWGGRGEGMAF